MLGYGISINSDAHPIRKGNKFEQIGNKTECALLEMIYNLGYNFEEIRKETKAINTVPFSSARKRMSVIYQVSKTKKFFIFSKGAPEILLESCKYYISKTNSISEIDSNWRDEFNSTINQFSNDSLRTLLLCYR